MTDDAAAILENSHDWKEIASAIQNNRCPQSVAAVVPSAMQQMFAERYGKMILGDGPMWKDGEHPDLINAGKYMTPPSIDECRMLHGELGLYPLVSDKRLAVIWAADKLSLEASNSLLKLTEEPPAHGSVIFISDEDRLIPTIKSRVWPMHIDIPEELVMPRPHPFSPEEWAQWFENGKKSGPEILFMEMEGWVRYLSEKGNYVKAADVESLVRIMEQKRLSAAMIQDLAFAVIKEGVPCEQIFGDLW